MSNKTTREIAREEAGKVEDDLLETFARRREMIEELANGLERATQRMDKIERKMSALMVYLEATVTDPEIADKLQRIDQKNDA